MTWNFDPSGGSFDAYDHTGSRVATNQEITDSWAYDRQTDKLTEIPQDMLEVMREEQQAALDSGNTARAIQINTDATYGQIEHGPP